jgi:hypothetical protein
MGVLVKLASVGGCAPHDGCAGQAGKCRRVRLHLGTLLTGGANRYGVLALNGDAQVCESYGDFGGGDRSRGRFAIRPPIRFSRTVACVCWVAG